MIALLAAALLAAAPASEAPQQDAETAAPEAIAAAEWLVGRWVGTGMGGEVEEIWSPPMGGQMVGHFIYAREGEPIFYELILLRPAAAGGLEYLVKHFDKDFTAWEEKDEWITFAAVEQAHENPRRIEFKGLSLIEDADVLTATVQMRGRDGSVRGVPFVMERAD